MISGVLLALVTSGVWAQLDCGAPPLPDCGSFCGSDPGALAKTKENIDACIFMRGPGWNGGSGAIGVKKVTFGINVDKFEALNIVTGSPAPDAKLYPDGANYTGHMTELLFAVGGKSVTAYNLAYKKGENEQFIPNWKSWITDGKVAPFFTVIVWLDAGKIYKVFWEAGCSLCGGDKSQNCIKDHPSDVKPGVTRNSANHACLKPSGDGENWGTCNDCSYDLAKVKASDKAKLNPLIYVAWRGTDSNNEPLTSASKTIGRFRRYSLKGLYEASYATAESFAE